MTPATFLLAFLFLRVTSPKSLINEVKTANTNSSPDIVEDENDFITETTDENFELQNSFDVQYDLVSLLLDKLLLDTLRENTQTLRKSSEKKRLRHSRHLSEASGGAEVLRPGRRARWGGGRGRGDLIPYPRVG
jgi:hypothetical protein